MTGPLVLFRISEETRDLIRLALISVAAFRAINSVKLFFKLRSIFYIGSAVFLIVLAFGVSMTATEKQYSNSNIRSLSDGLWWAVSTVSTVGYGDKFPVSNPGRVIATGLMFIGVALFSILTATLASNFAARANTDDIGQFERIHERLDRIERNQQTGVAVRRARAPRRPRRTTPPPRTGTESTAKE
jgi:voltage-gated potassium channel